MISIQKNVCDYCSACITVCPVDCIEVLESSIDIIDEKCINCDLCIFICPIDALVSNNAV